MRTGISLFEYLYINQSDNCNRSPVFECEELGHRFKNIDLRFNSFLSAEALKVLIIFLNDVEAIKPFSVKLKLTPKHFRLISIWMPDICFAAGIEKFCRQNQLKEWLISYIHEFFSIIWSMFLIYWVGWECTLCRNFLKKNCINILSTWKIGSDDHIWL